MTCDAARSRQQASCVTSVMTGKIQIWPMSALVSLRICSHTFVSVPSTVVSAAAAASSSVLACALPSSDLERVCSFSSTPAASRAASANGSSSEAAAIMSCN